MVGGRGGGASGFLGMWGGGWLFFRRERIPPMQARVTSVSLPEGEEGQEDEAGEEDKDGRWETVYAYGGR